MGARERKERGESRDVGATVHSSTRLNQHSLESGSIAVMQSTRYGIPSPGSTPGSDPFPPHTGAVPAVRYAMRGGGAHAHALTRTSTPFDPSHLTQHSRAQGISQRAEDVGATMTTYTRLSGSTAVCNTHNMEFLVLVRLQDQTPFPVHTGAVVKRMPCIFARSLIHPAHYTFPADPRTYRKLP